MLTIPAKTLKAALTAVKPAVPTRYTAIPVLKACRLAARNGRVTVTGTDLDLTLSHTVDGDGDLLTLAPHGRLFKLLARPTGDVTITADEADRVTVTHDGITVGLRTFPTDEWPMLDPGPTTGTLPPPGVGLASVLPAAGTDEDRPIIAVVAVDDDGLTATNSYIMHRWGAMVEHEDPVLIPVRSAKVLTKLLGDDDGKVTVHDRHVRLEHGDTTVTARTTEGTYPNMLRLFPTDPPVAFEFDHDELTAAVGKMEKARKALGADWAPVVLSADDDGVRLTITVQDAGEASAVVPGSMVLPDGLKLNPTFLAMALDGCDTTVALGVDHLKPVTFECGESHRLLMPVR